MGAVAVLRGRDLGPAVALFGLFVAVSAALVFGIGTGHFNDFDVSERKRRPGFYVLVTGATLALGFWLRDDPAALHSCAIAGATLVACAVLNRWTKVSLHTAFALYVAGYWGAWSIGAGLVALAAAGGIAWSRVHLGRHSRGEVQLGAMIGLVAAAGLIVFSSDAPSTPSSPAAREWPSR